MRLSDIVNKLSISGSNMIKQQERILGLQHYEAVTIINLFLSIIYGLDIDREGIGTSGSNMIE